MFCFDKTGFEILPLFAGHRQCIDSPETQSKSAENVQLYIQRLVKIVKSFTSAIHFRETFKKLNGSSCYVCDTGVELGFMSHV